MPKSPLTGEVAPTRPTVLQKVTSSRGGLRAVATLAVGALLGVTGAGVAQADDLYNTILGTATNVAINDRLEVMSFVEGDDAKATGLRVQARNSGIDGFEGCNTQRGGSVTFAFSSSDEAVAVVETPTLTFTTCTAAATGALQEELLRIRPVRAGSATITARVQSGPAAGSYRLDSATVKVEVAPPANREPAVTVIGVTPEGRYLKGGEMPTPMCEATDAEDGTKVFAPALSRPAPQLPDGLGERLAKCSFTDSRGATASASASWFIDDPEPPVVRYILSKPAPANGWYRDEVRLDWVVTEPQSPGTLTTEGCEQRWITADQKATDYTCTATSAGGPSSATARGVQKDGTGPTVTGTIAEQGVVVGERTWYAARPTVTWSAADDVSGVLDGSLAQTIDFASHEGRNMMVRAVATDNAGNSAGASVQYINVDASAPVVRAELIGTPAYDNGTTAWYKDQATVQVTASDPDVQPFERGSGLADDPSGSHVVTTTGPFQGSATDRVGHVGTSDAVQVTIDATAPTTSITCPKLPWVKGLPLKTTWTAADEAGGSGLATPAKGTLSLDTKVVGQRSATAPAATDNVGHTGAAATCGYRVIYPFVGFLNPIDNFGVYNKVKAGSAVPVKFSLLGNQGMDILSGAPVATKVTCPSGARTDSLEETASAKSTSGLKYDSKSGLYNYTWKTPTSYAGTCQKLTVNLADGMSYSALFTFTK